MNLRHRTRWLLAATGVVLAAAAVTAGLALATPPPPPAPPDPFALTPEGRYQVPAALTTAGVDPCSLLTAQEVGTAYVEPPVFFSRATDDPDFCFYSGGEQGIVVSVGYPTDRITEPVTEAGIAAYITVGGHPARLYAPADQVGCVVAVTADAVPGRPGLMITGSKADSCAVPLQLAELALSRLPVAP